LLCSWVNGDFNMKSLRDMLAALLVAGAALAAPAMIGCYASGGAYIVDDEPPPPREEVVVSRPGFFWIHGHWERPGGHWAWRSGYYERERPEQVYVEGRWERRNNGHVWVDGGWRARGHVVVRDHDHDHH
jgi:YXWGXW repeat-containing protein